MTNRGIVPFLDLRAQHAEIAVELDNAWNQVTATARFVGGESVERFESEWAGYCNTRHCVGVSDGTAAIKLAFQALGIGAGDEVIVPANTFIATWEAIAAVGAKPVPVDVDPHTLLLTADAVSAACTPRTAAVVPVHLFGQTVDMDAINQVARRAGIYVVEDAAQAHGATWRGRRAGGLGDVGCFSFYPGKNLGAFGDAGAVVTNSQELSDRMRSLGNHGRHRDSADQHIYIGMNHRLDNLQAAILAVKLPYLEQWNAARRSKAQRYDRLLSDLPLDFVGRAPEAESSFHLYVVQVSQRDRVRCELETHGVSTGIHYRTPCHRQPAFSLNGTRLPVTERAAKRIVSLPMFPHLTDQQIDQVVDALRLAVRPPHRINGGRHLRSNGGRGQIEVNAGAA
jgi:dTDP-4-amino-4,6-dideoxygalactose transaminase